MNKNIHELSIVELKAIKSDIYESIAQGQANLQLINQELAKRNEDSAKIDKEISTE